uniref:Sulfotransferase n=1 Tax=Strix occidentalis caurina TaxID=311401 RepID=A0A8D0KUZ5_STROC
SNLQNEELPSQEGEGFSFRCLPFSQGSNKKVSFSGTVWTQNILSLIIHEGHRNGTENVETMERIPWLEYRTKNRDYTVLPSPRVFATHLPYYLLPRDLRNKRGRIIYVTRNPKDVMVSYYHFSKYMSTLEEIPDFNLFMERFLAGKGRISWLDHVAGWYSHAEDFNILFVTYEEMKKEARNCFPRLALCSGLWRDAHSASHLPLLPLSSGTVGDWKNIMTVAQNERFDKVLSEKMKTLDLYVAFSGVAH